MCGVFVCVCVCEREWCVMCLGVCVVNACGVDVWCVC